MLTTLLFGVVPSWRAVQVDPQTAARLGARDATKGQTRFGLGKTLVGMQVALSLVMIATAALLIDSWRQLSTLDPGFRSDGVLMVGVNSRPAQLAPEVRGLVYRQILERLRGLPDTAAAGAAWRTPFGANAVITIEVAGSASASAVQARIPDNEVSEGYFATIGTPIIAGRDFNTDDVAAAPEVAIVNEELSRTFFAGDALGKRFRVLDGASLSPPVQIVGIVGNTKENSLIEASKAIVYFATNRSARPAAVYNFIVRARGTTAALAPEV